VDADAERADGIAGAIANGYDDGAVNAVCLALGRTSAVLSD
jgi:hypothetical protein